VNVSDASVNVIVNVSDASVNVNEANAIVSEASVSEASVSEASVSECAMKCYMFLNNIVSYII
jgi:hypothetical protein